jgi:serine/threonine-protein kinase RsbW
VSLGTSAVDRVELWVPADPAYLAVLRTASAGLAARMDLTLDEIEDLRIAVDEACALLLGGVEGCSGGDDGQDGTGDLHAVFDVERDVLAVRVTGPTPRLPERSSFAWAVLEALAGEIEIGTDDGRNSIVLRHHRALRAS